MQTTRCGCGAWGTTVRARCEALEIADPATALRCARCVEELSRCFQACSVVQIDGIGLEPEHALDAKIWQAIRAVIRPPPPGAEDGSAPGSMA